MTRDNTMRLILVEPPGGARYFEKTPAWQIGPYDAREEMLRGATVTAADGTRFTDLLAFYDRMTRKDRT